MRNSFYTDLREQLDIGACSEETIINLLCEWITDRRKLALCGEIYLSIALFGNNFA